MAYDDVQQRISAFWDEVAPGYDGPSNVAAPASDDYDRWAEALRSVLPPPPARVLDVGTGTGFAAGIMAELGHEVIGTDLSTEMLAVARSKGHRVTYLEGDAVRPAFPPGYVDVILSRSLIWTLRHLDTAFRNWFDVLGSGGRVVAIYGLVPAAAVSGENDDEPDNLFTRHYTPATRATLAGMQLTGHDRLLAAARGAGFTDISTNVLEMVRGWETSPGSELPYALVGLRP